MTTLNRGTSQHAGITPATMVQATSSAASPDREPQAREIRLEVGPRVVRTTASCCRTLVVTGYPREVGPGWLAPLLTHPAQLDVSVYIEPIPAALAAEWLRRQLARLQTTQHLDADRGRLEDFEVEAAAADARELARQLARGEGRLFRVGLTVSIHANNEEELEEETGRVRALLASLLLDAHPTTYRTLQGWLATQPLALDRLGQLRTFDTQALAASFPFATAELSSSGGVVYGRTVESGGLVCWDRFAQVNHNSVILARSGAGKSYLAKLELLRWLYQGVHAAVIDPEDEYQPLAAAVGGAAVRLGAPGVRFNPLDLHPADGDQALARRGLFIHTLVSVLLGEPLDPVATAALDRAVTATYAAAGITPDPATHTSPAPLLRDLAAALARDHEDPASLSLAARLAPYVTGMHRGLFDGPTTTRPHSHLVVFGLRHLPEELIAVGTLLTLDAIWRQVSDPADRARRLVVVDEAWLLMQHPAGARFLHRLAKSARKYTTGLTVITQDAADLLGSDLGQAVVANAATQVLLGQAPQAVDALADSFRLSDGERAFLLGARRGEGLLTAGPQRVAFRAEASPAEHTLLASSQEFTSPAGDRDPAALPRAAAPGQATAATGRRRRRRRAHRPSTAPRRESRS